MITSTSAMDISVSHLLGGLPRICRNYRPKTSSWAIVAVGWIPEGGFQRSAMAAHCVTISFID